MQPGACDFQEKIDQREERKKEKVMRCSYDVIMPQAVC
jgi:hypothetical protein